MNAVPSFYHLAIDLAVAIRASCYLSIVVHLGRGVDITRWGALEGTGEEDGDCKSEVQGECNPQRDSRDAVRVADSEKEENHGGLDEGEDRVVEQLVRDVVLPACDSLLDAKMRDVRFVVTLPGVEGIWLWSVFLVVSNGMWCCNTSYNNT